MSSSPPAHCLPTRPSHDRASRCAQRFAAWRAGDARAGEALFRDLRVVLTTWFCGCPRHVVDDLIQETLVACVMARETLRHDEAFAGFVRCVARRVLFHHLYRGRCMASFEEGSACDEDREAGLDKLEVRRLLGTCASPHALVVALRYLEGRRGVEIARMLRISEASVRRRLRRGLEELQRAASPSASS